MSAAAHEAVFESLESRPPAERVAQLIGEALEGEGFSSHSADERRRVVEAFRTRRLLVVWDNAESVLPECCATPPPDSRGELQGGQALPKNPSFPRLECNERSSRAPRTPVDYCR